MSAKLAYYRTAGMQPTLAARYLREFAGLESILDVGCGTGAFGGYAPVGMNVFGVDRDEGALAKARAFEQVAQVDLEHDRLPFDDAAFDGVLAKDILEHLQRPGDLVGEIARVLRPGGVVIASLVTAKPRVVWRDYTHVRGFTRRSATLLFEDAGFTLESIWLMGPVPLSNRLGFMDLVPYILRVPGPAQLWATSWELRARKPAMSSQG